MPTVREEAIEELIGADRIRERVVELARQITEDYRGRSLILLGVLKGAALFLADLVRHIELDVTYDFVSISSYGNETRSSGVVRLIKDADMNLESKHVLVVEDIVDTGLTLTYLLDLMQSRRPASLRVCALLDKPSRRQINVPIDYLGFSIPDEFVIGFGLDVAEKYRNLPFIGIYRGGEASL